MKVDRSLKTTFGRARNGFCHGAMKFTKGKTLPKAWASCKIGSWMAWWLFYYRGIDSVGAFAFNHDNGHLRQLATEAGLGSAIFVPFSSEAAQQAAYADLIRKHYKSNGRRLDVAS